MRRFNYVDKKRKIVNYDGYFNRHMNEYLYEEIPEYGVKKINMQSLKIFSLIPKMDGDNVSSTGIMVGKVQSGKTSNFLSLISLAFDNGFDIAIVIGGNKKNLLKQNTDRIKKAFENTKENVYIVTSNQIRENTYKNFERLFTGKGNYKIIFTVLKNDQAHISKVKKFIFEKSKLLSNMPTIIIDDEGDQASLNVKRYQKKESTTYSSLKGLRNSINKHCFISVTATPQANLLVAKSDILSPDFIGLIYPGEGYCGLDTFHANNDEKYIKKIDSKENVFLEDSGVPESFYRALADFIVGICVRIYKGDVGHYSMLIHPSAKVKDHKVVYNKVSEIVYSSWLEKIQHRNDISFNNFISKHIEPAYYRFISDDVKLPSLDKIISKLPDFCQFFGEVKEINSKTSFSTNVNPIAKYNIYIGGEMLGRGITIPGLSVTYIFRIAKSKSNVDTLEQRARWFGYRNIPKNSYLDICRVYTTDDIKRYFNSIYNHEEDLWDTLEYAERNNIPAKNMKRLFLLEDNKLQLTRKSVGKTKREYKSRWKYQYYFQNIEEYSVNNWDVLKSFLSNKKSEIINIVGSSNHLLYRDISFADLLENALSKYMFPKREGSLDLAYFNKLHFLIEKYKFETNVNILIMRYETGERRTLQSDFKISQLMQGRGSKDINLVSQGIKYPGDKHLFENDKNIQLQIHKVYATNTTQDKFSPTLAIRLPYKLVYALNKYLSVEEM